MRIQQSCANSIAITKKKSQKNKKNELARATPLGLIRCSKVRKYPSLCEEKKKVIES